MNFRKYLHYLRLGCKSHKSEESLILQIGEFVEVRSINEILNTLNENNTLDGLPFTPEMLKYCGSKFKVLKLVDKINVEGVGMRQIKDTVILEGVTCNGEAHGGCNRTCLLFWKKAWLKKPPIESSKDQEFTQEDALKKRNCATSKGQTFSCQITNLINASSPNFWDINQHLFDLTLRFNGSKIAKLFKFIYSILSSSIFKVQHLLGIKKHANLNGKLKRTPTSSLNLQPGEIVEVKGKEEIQATLDVKGRNRGLAFANEMLRYCGGRYRVLKRIDKMINEQTGQMRQIPNTVILEGVHCDGSFHGGCKRTCYCLWREIWLKRITQEQKELNRE
ncbi:MAG: hypothetical protein QW279_00570 [Candidatus Jordarchaeaceae archaeon]